jgi:hypothetical protein
MPLRPRQGFVARFAVIMRSSRMFLGEGSRPRESRARGRCRQGCRSCEGGDWVCLPFNIACGFCKNCERGLTSACLSCNPGSAGAAYAYAENGPLPEGAGRAVARALRRFQLPRPAARCRGEAKRLREARGYLADRMARDGAGEGPRPASPSSSTTPGRSACLRPIRPG